MNTDNVILRVHNLIEQAYKEAGGSSLASYRETWANVFEVDENDTASLLSSLSLLFESLRTIRSIIESHPSLNDEKNMEFLNQIELGVYHVNLKDGKMGEFYKYIKTETLTAFYYIGKTLSLLNEFSANELDSEEINSLISEIEELTHNFSISTLPDKLKLIAINKLNLIREALTQYAITGPEAIEAALEQTAGSILLNPDTFLTESNSQEVNRFFKIMDRVAKLLGLGNSAAQLIEHITKFLPPVK
ncbi:hypothetical protein MOC94_21610 [Bacillus haynesii]|uniref:hypothetical protein n=1 Tax=Bacillus haynesii TaxID=1925021 RepID=UPI00227FA674|nr:hypothetical protein [Bacillus haynesii]MCY8045751.1 hypothetical protein [Bacillus haynesii]MCY8080525.1 hypothetical protein [Bacillus haynesii]MCY8385746.1 hypothetical protein [Bacillus haynesii]MCY8590286.1 hypothetical protein [Bacillus haynesii]MEC0720710.1 hypothetical protein [Bacillus haynesii]